MELIGLLLRLKVLGIMYKLVIKEPRVLIQVAATIV